MTETCVKHHLKTVGENIERVNYILNCLTTTEKERKYYRTIQKRCNELYDYLVKRIN